MSTDLVFPLPHLLDGARWRGMRIGLLGGSFNPPHEGHVHISHAALKALRLDCVWWLVTPQNPLKTMNPMPIEKRVALSRAIVQHPRILVTEIETALGTQLTYDTVRTIRRRFADTDFVWISGMDNALNLHQWNHWRNLLEEISMLHLTRSPAKSLVRSCPLRMYARQRHIVIHRPGRYCLEPGRSYWMLQSKMINVSSTEIRLAQDGAQKH